MQTPRSSLAGKSRQHTRVDGSASRLPRRSTNLAHLVCIYNHYSTIVDGLVAAPTEAMGLSTPVLRAIRRKGYRLPTPIQRKAMPLILQGDDVVGMARTGSGKTAAFVIPLVHRYATMPQQRCHNNTTTTPLVNVEGVVYTGRARACHTHPSHAPSCAVDNNCTRPCNRLAAHVPASAARAVVLSPTRELALQTFQVWNVHGHTTCTTARVLPPPTHTHTHIRNGIDVCVTQPRGCHQRPRLNMATEMHGYNHALVAWKHGDSKQTP